MHLRFLLIPTILATLLAACASSGDTARTGAGTSAGAARNHAPATVNPAEAAALISQYRQSRGLPAVSTDPTLMKIAADHSRAMAQADRMAHVLPGQGSFGQKLATGGFRPATAAENVAAGQQTLERVLEAWRKSPGHNANLLLSGATKIGIAVANNPSSTYGAYWTLIIGEWRKPGETGSMDGPNAGPFIIPTQTGATLTIGGGAG